MKLKCNNECGRYITKNKYYKIVGIINQYNYHRFFYYDDKNQLIDEMLAREGIIFYGSRIKDIRFENEEKIIEIMYKMEWLKIDKIGITG